MAEFQEEEDQCLGPDCKLCAEYGGRDGGTDMTDGQAKENIVYLITSEEGVPYVGMTTTNFNHRMAQHRHAIKAGHGDGTNFIEYYQTHDFEAARKDILYNGGPSCSKEMLHEKEKEWIQYYNRISNGLVLNMQI